MVTGINILRRGGSSPLFAPAGRDPLTGQSAVNPLAFALTQEAPRTGAELGVRLLSLGIAAASQRAEQRALTEALQGALGPRTETRELPVSDVASAVPAGSAMAQALQSPEAANLVAPGLPEPTIASTTERQPTRREITTSLLGSGSAQAQRLGAQLALSSALSGQEQFVDVTDPAGNVIAQRSTTTNRLQQSPLAPELLSPEELAQQLQLRQAGRAVTNVNVGPQGIDFGDPPKDFAWARNPDNTIATEATTLADGRTVQAPIAVPVAGGPAQLDIEAAEQAAERMAANTKRTVNTIIENIDDIGRFKAEENLLPTVGTIAPLFARFSETGAGKIRRALETIEANIGFEALSQMRQASPTGGAVGQLSDSERQALASTMGNLAQSQDPEQFDENLRRVKRDFLSVVHGPMMTQEQLDIATDVEITRFMEGLFANAQSPDPVIRERAQLILDTIPANIFTQLETRLKNARP